jgi:hypothetical protein|tara:strand:+ start:2021 stop:3013 length:993 start_codon:yes stop_codon:yes gene_type:complete
MPEEEKKTVDIDTSGPAMDVDIPEQKDESTIEEKEVVQKEEPTIREVVEEKPAVEKAAEVKEETKEVKEETKDEKELEHYSEGVQKRIAKLTKKWREAERQKDEAISYAERMMRAKEKADAKISKLEPSFMSVTDERIISGMEAAKAKLAAAREANDLGAEATALAEISELGVKRAQFNETKAAQEEYAKQQETKKKEPSLARQLTSKGTPDPKAEAWADNNTWFGQDNAMTYTAFDLHKTLTEKEGFDPSSDEYYKEIDKRIRLEFPHKFDKKSVTESTKPVQTVASAKRSTKTGRKTVRLTPSQVTIAKKLGVPLEEYAKQLTITKEA